MDGNKIFLKSTLMSIEKDEFLVSVHLTVLSSFFYYYWFYYQQKSQNNADVNGPGWNCQENHGIYISLNHGFILIWVQQCYKALLHNDFGCYILKYGTDLIPLFAILHIGLQHRSSLTDTYYTVNLIFIGQWREYCCCSLSWLYLFYLSQIFFKDCEASITLSLEALSDMTYEMKNACAASRRRQKYF